MGGNDYMIFQTFLHTFVRFFQSNYQNIYVFPVAVTIVVETFGHIDPTPTNFYPPDAGTGTKTNLLHPPPTTRGCILQL